MNDGAERFLASAIGSVHRLAMEIVALPATQRPMAFNVAELDFAEVASAAGWAAQRVEEFVGLQMGALRALVDEIEATGGAQGGRA
jgi:hypothetical protein